MPGWTGPAAPVLMEATGGAPKYAAPYRSAEAGGHEEPWEGGWLGGLTSSGAAG